MRKTLYLQKGSTFILHYFCVLLFLIFTTIHAQNSQTIASLERAYDNGTLTYLSPTLLINTHDSSAEKAAKSYFKGILTTDISSAILTHSINFNDYPDEYYGQLSGIQLVSIDFINNEYDKALLKIENINSIIVPEVLYWKAKITFAMQKYDTTISICQTFLSSHPTHSLAPKMWVTVLEALYHKADKVNFEKNYNVFASHASFTEYKPYLLYLNGYLNETSDIPKATNLYSTIITAYPASQFRVQAEDRLFLLRQHRDPSPITQNPTNNTPFKNVVVDKYENLRKGSFYIQFGAFDTEIRAKNLSGNLTRDKISAFTITKPVDNKRVFAVIQGPFGTLRDAEKAQGRINSKKHPTFIFEAR